MLRGDSWQETKWFPHAKQWSVNGSLLWFCTPAIVLKLKMQLRPSHEAALECPGWTLLPYHGGAAGAVLAADACGGMWDRAGGVLRSGWPWAVLHGMTPVNLLPKYFKLFFLLTCLHCWAAAFLRKAVSSVLSLFRKLAIPPSF